MNGDRQLRDALVLDQFTLRDAGSCGRPLHFSTDDEDLDRRRSGERAGSVTIFLGVDLDHDIVALDANGGSTPLDLLDAAIEDLRQIRDTLAAHSPSAGMGRCMFDTAWGRCNRASGHEGPHEGPTEAEWEAHHPPHPG